MIPVSKAELEDIRALINNRLAEFECDLPSLSVGMVRVALDVIAEWQRESEHMERRKTVRIDTVVIPLREEPVPMPTSLPFPPTNGSHAPLNHTPPDLEAESKTAHAAVHEIAARQFAKPISVKAAATLGPEHTIVTPLKVPDPDAARDTLAHAVATGGVQLDGNVTRSNGTHRAAKVRGLADGYTTGVDALDDGFDKDEDGDELPKRRVRPSGKRKPSPRKMGYELSQQGKRPGMVTPTLDELVKELQRQAMAGTMPTQAQFDLAKPATWGTAQAHLKRLETSWTELMELAGLKPNRRGE